MTANRELMDELGFALKHDGKEWLVIEDGADDRCATITEQVLWEALTEALTTPVARAEPTHLHRADGTLSGVFIEPAASEAAAVAAELRNWFDFLPGHAQPTIELAVRLLETRP